MEYTGDVVIDRTTHPVTELTAAIRGIYDVVDGDGKHHAARYYQKTNMTSGECLTCVFDENGDMLHDKDGVVLVTVKHKPPLMVKTDYGDHTEEHLRELLSTDPV